MRSMSPSNFLLLTYDSCRYDVLVEARTPVLDSFSEIFSAQTPANYTYAAHLSFFVGMLPNVSDDIEYYNRFTRQLMGLMEVGETNVAKNALVRLESAWNLPMAFMNHGYQTIGAGAMNWFRQHTLSQGFDRFRFTGTDADAQIDFLLGARDADRPFFGFINFGETHAPFSYAGKEGVCPVDVRARNIRWPPREVGPVGRANEAFEHQKLAAEFLDGRLPRLFSGIPDNTVVVLCADHGECFGEDGYWGHGFNHPQVLEVPLAIFRLDGLPVGESRI
jgi:membrane-anchored protein YejM (alkaline phosphatase superfamily)